MSRAGEIWVGLRREDMIADFPGNEPGLRVSDLSQTIRLLSETEITPEDLARVRAHPRFPDAIRHICQSVIDHYNGNRVLNALVNDRGRMRMAFLALYLHYTRRLGDPNSGLTVNRLKALCVEQKFCSGGRAEAMIALMRMFGYLREATNDQDRRLKLLIPTDKLIRTHVERWLWHLEAVAMVLDEGRLGLEALKRPEFMPALLRQLVERHLAGLRILDAAPGLEMFTDRNGGWMILFSLITGGDARDTVPPSGPVSVSISGLARRFGVSRVHVRKLLADAAAEGFIVRSGGHGEEIVMQPRVREGILEVFSLLLVTFAQAAMAAVEEVGEARAVA